MPLKFALILVFLIQIGGHLVKHIRHHLHHPACGAGSGRRHGNDLYVSVFDHKERNGDHVDTGAGAAAEVLGRLLIFAAAIRITLKANPTKNVVSNSEFLLISSSNVPRDINEPTNL